MVYRGRGNPRSRGFIRPFRARGRGRRPFPYRGQSRGGYGRGREDEGLRITLRNTGRDHHEGEYERQESEPDRHDSYEDYADDYSEQQSKDFEQGDWKSSRREAGRSTPPRKRPHMESDLTQEESLRITVGNDLYEEQFPDRQPSPHSSRWEQEGRDRRDNWSEERRDDRYYKDRGSNEERRHSRDEDHQEGSYDNRRSHRSPDSYRGRGRGYYSRGYDPNYRGRGRGDFRGGYRGRGRGNYEHFDRSGRGYFRNFDRGRGQGSYHPRDRRSFDGDFDREGDRRRSHSRDRRRSRSRDRYSRSPGRRRSRSYGRGRSRSRERRSYSRNRRSYSRDRRSYSRERRSYSRDRRSGSRRRRSQSSSSRSRSYSYSQRSSSRSYSRNRSPGRRSFSRSLSQSPGRRRQLRSRSVEQERLGAVSNIEERGSSPPHARSTRRSLNSGEDQHSPNGMEERDRRSSSSSSTSSSGSRSNESHPVLTEQQYEQEMYRRLKSEIASDKDPRQREESIAKHIREMAKLSPVLFRQFMAKNAGNLSVLALGQSEQPSEQSAEMTSTEPNEMEDSRPLRSILKRKADSRSPSLDRNSSPLSPQPKSLTQIEKVIQALRKGGTRQTEQKPEKLKENTPPPSGALRHLSSYMDIEEEEEFLYGDNTKPEPESAAPSGPFWSADRFGEKSQQDGLDVLASGEAEPATSKPPSVDMFENLPTASQLAEHVKVPPAFSSFEEKEKSYEQWRAAVFQKQPPKEKPKETVLPQNVAGGGESAEQLSSTVENILKSIGFNFELSQRMQELARQKKEGEQEAIKINQSASFLGADPDALAENLTDVFEKGEDMPKSKMSKFMQEVEAATKAAKEKAQKAKEAEERRTHGRNIGAERDSSRKRDKFRSRRESRGYREGGERPRKDSSGNGTSSRYGAAASEHSPYDPSVQDYRQQDVYPSQQYGGQDTGGFDPYQESSGLFEGSQQPKSVRSSNLISLGGENRRPDEATTRYEDNNSSQSRHASESRHSDHNRRDRSAEDASYKKTGERILIVKKKEEAGRIDSPGSDSAFSRRIVLPPKERGKPGKNTDSDSRKDGKRRASSPLSPRHSKQSRGASAERVVFQRSKSGKQTEPDRPQPAEGSSCESKYNYLSPKGSKDADSKGRSEPRTAGSSSSKTDFLKAQAKEELPKSQPKIQPSVVKNAVRAAEDKAHMLERTRKVLALEKELDALQQQHNELLRKRRRQKDGHKDPLIIENTKLQDEISAQIKALRDGYESVSFDEVSSTDKSKESVSDSSPTKMVPSKQGTVEKETAKVQYEYFDPGSHWCSACNIVCGHMFDFLKHVESKKHQQKLDPFNRPWLIEAMQKQEKKAKPQGPVQAHPIKGLEFMMATAAFYCSLCSEFCGDLSIAESHMKSEEHHNKYRDYLNQHPYYEKRVMLERSAALSMQKRHSPEKEQEDSQDSDDTQLSEEANKKSATKSKSLEKNSSKIKNENWREKIFSEKTMYSDYEEEFRKKSDSKDRDKRRYRERSPDPSRSSRDSRDERDSPRERRDSRDRKDANDRREKEDDKNRSAKPNAKDSKVSSRTTEPAKEGKAVDADVPVGEQPTPEGAMKEERKKEGQAVPDHAKEEAKAEAEAKREGETEVKGKIPIKLTGKSGIKPAVPLLKAMTRPIPKVTAQKRLLAARSQLAAAASARGPGMPNEDPVPLADFLTVGVKKSVPVLPDVTHIPIPPDPKTLRKEAAEAAENREALEEMKMLGIDPVSLVPDVTPRPPPPPSQNLSLPLHTRLVAEEASPVGGSSDGAGLEMADSVSSSKPDTRLQAPQAGPTSDSVHKAKVEVDSNPASVTEAGSCVAEGAAGLYPLQPIVPQPAVAPVPAAPPPAPRGLLVTPNTAVPPPGYIVPMPILSLPPPPFVPPLPNDPPPPLTAPNPPPLPPPPLPAATPPPPPPPDSQHTAPMAPSCPAAELHEGLKPVSPKVSEASAPQEPSSGPADTPAVQSSAAVPAIGVDAVCQAEAVVTVAAALPSNTCVSAVGDATAVGELAQVMPSTDAHADQEGTDGLASTTDETAACSAEGQIPAMVSEGPEPSIDSEPQPSTSTPEASLSSEALEPSSSQASPKPGRKTAARRGRGAKRAAPALPTPAEESVESGIGAAPGGATRRPRTRSQVRPQSQRQTRSRTRQQKSEEEEVSVSASDEGSINLAEEVSISASDEGSIKLAEEVSVSASDEGSIKLAEEVSVSASDEGSIKLAEEVSVSASDEGSIKLAEGVSVSTSDEGSTKLAEEVSVSASDEGSIRLAEEVSVSASDEGSMRLAEEVGSSAPEADMGEGGKASSTSACVLDLTNPPADTSGGQEASAEVTSSSCEVKSSPVVSSPPADSALNLTVPPELREARPSLMEQTMPEDLSSYAQPQDLSTSSEGRAVRAPEMPMDLTMRLNPSQSTDSRAVEEVPQPMETQQSPSCQISSSEGLAQALDPQSVKDTLLSSTSALNPAASSLGDLGLGDEGGLMETAPSVVSDSAGLGVDPEGELDGFNLAIVDFEQFAGMEVEDPTAAPEGATEEENGGTADTTFPSN